MNGMFHLKLLINFAPLLIAGQIDWHAPMVTTVRSGGALAKLRESSGSAPRGLSSVLITVSPTSIFGIDNTVELKHKT